MRLHPDLSSSGGTSFAPDQSAKGRQVEQGSQQPPAKEGPHVSFLSKIWQNTSRILSPGFGKSWLMQSLKRRTDNMQFDISPQPVVALIAGIAILLAPKLLNYIVAIYLIIFGILGLVRI
jgi:hypothetical protein